MAHTNLAKSPNSLLTSGNINALVSVSSDGKYGLGTETPSVFFDVRSTTNFGVNATGVDVQMFGANSGSNFKWDKATNKLILTSAKINNVNENTFFAYASAGIAIGTASGNLIFDSESFDPDSAYNVATGRWTVPTTGKYNIYGQVSYIAGAAYGGLATLTLTLVKNDAGTPVTLSTGWMRCDAAGNSYATAHVAGVFSLTAGDTVVIQGDWSTNGYTSAGGASNDYFCAHYIGS